MCLHLRRCTWRSHAHRTLRLQGKASAAVAQGCARCHLALTWMWDKASSSSLVYRGRTREPRDGVQRRAPVARLRRHLDREGVLMMRLLLSADAAIGVRQCALEPKLYGIRVQLRPRRLGLRKV